MSVQDRPLEFRAYHSPTHNLFAVAFFTQAHVVGLDLLTTYPRSECVLMQFTGLYDSQGQKVFEGDILHSYYPAHGREPSAEYWRVVVFREGCFIELQRIDEELTVYNFEPMQDTKQDRIVDCYYLRPDLLSLNIESGTVPSSFN